MDKYAYLVLHGFGGDMKEVQPIIDMLKKYTNDVYAPPISQHGKGKNAVTKTNVSDWILSAQDAFYMANATGKQVIIIGFSMGAALTAHLAIRCVPTAIVLLATPIEVWDIKFITKELVEMVTKRDRALYEKYQRACTGMSIKTMLDMHTLIQQTKKILPSIWCPAFVAQGMQDATVQSRSGIYTYTHIGSKYKKYIQYPFSGHWLCIGPETTKLQEDIATFITTFPLTVEK